jgi:NADH:ubiquinone oxidoreductase subunit B-like Fe-S oxidoreductase
MVGFECAREGGAATAAYRTIKPSDQWLPGELVGPGWLVDAPNCCITGLSTPQERDQRSAVTVTGDQQLRDGGRREWMHDDVV